MFFSFNNARHQEQPSPLEVIILWLSVPKCYASMNSLAKRPVAIWPADCFQQQSLVKQISSRISNMCSFTVRDCTVRKFKEQRKKLLKLLLLQQSKLHLYDQWVSKAHIFPKSS